MAKKYHCAQCAAEVKVIQRPLPQKGIVMNLVEPHSCEETKEEDKFSVESLDPVEKGVKEVKTKLDDLFNSFTFVKKLNKATEVKPMTSGPGDLRPKSSRREELPTSTAPFSILDRAQKDAGIASPARNEGEFEDE